MTARKFSIKTKSKSKSKQLQSQIEEITSTKVQFKTPDGKVFEHKEDAEAWLKEQQDLSELEKEFRESIKKYHNQIEKKMSEIVREREEAYEKADETFYEEREKLVQQSEKTGVPLYYYFGCEEGGSDYWYLPYCLENKYNDLGWDKIKQILNENDIILRDGFFEIGWASSSC